MWSTVNALADAELYDELQQLQLRLLSQPAAILFESEPAGRDVVRWSFKPMVELLLLEAREAAEQAELAAAERRRRIAWAFEMAGF